MRYLIHRTPSPPPLDSPWDSAAWANAQTLEVNQFHARSNGHRPRTMARVLYDDRALYVRFLVHDRYVRSVRTRYQDNVCKDSCVEFFVAPGEMPTPYFNFEINCGGTMLLYFIEDARHGGVDEFRRYTPVPADVAGGVRIHHSLPAVVEPEITHPVDWTVAYTIPLVLLERYLGPIRLTPGTRWRANFYKCADETSHPHWAAWADIGQECSFHQPDRFGVLEFA